MVFDHRRIGLALRLLGLMAVVTTSARATEEWVLPDSALGSRTSPLLLLSRPEVRADLKLEDSQSLAASGAIADLRGRAALLRGPDTPQLVGARKQLEEAQRRWIEEHLTPNQRVRLQQIDFQWEGPAALITRPILAESLNLNEAQIMSLRQALGDRNAKQADGKPRGELEHLLAERTLATLTEPQRTRWKTLLGQPLIVRTAAAAPPTTATR